LYGSDTEAFAVLGWGVARGLPKGMREMGLVCIQLEIVLSERLLYPQHFDQVMRREACEFPERTLQLARGELNQCGHVGDRPDDVEIGKNSRCDWICCGMAMGHAPLHYFE
jgi:hypothetical protein